MSLFLFPQATMSSVPPLVCGDCASTVTFQTIEELKTHYVNRHNQRTTFTCGDPSCKTQLLNKTSLIRHIQAQHPYLLCGASSQQANQDAQDQQDIQGPSTLDCATHGTAPLQLAVQNTFGKDVPVNDSLTAYEEEATLIHEPPVPSEINLEKVAIKMVMELRSKSSLTGKAIERFQQGCITLLQGYRECVIQDLTVQLNGSGLPQFKIDEILNSVRGVEDVFSRVKTIEDQLETFATEFGLVKPDEYYLGSRLDKRLDPETNSYIQTQVNVTFQYISIIDTLKAILSNKKHRNNIFKDLQSQDGVLRSYVDGEHCRNHPFLQKYENVIHILLFYDALEVANSLGSKTIIHKLGAFFFQVINGPASACSKLSSIHLLILAYAADLKKPGAFDKVLTPFIAEMKKLSSDEGVEIYIDGQPFVLRALLTAVTADTEAAHELLGFLGAGARHFCRCCMISRAELRQDGNHVAEPRTKETHAQHVQEVSQNKRRSTLCGVSRDCPLNVLPYFHCVESSIFDAFHDLLQGIVPLVIKLVLRHFIIICELLTIDEFNTRVDSFAYGLPDSKNRPSPNFVVEMLTTRKKLKQTGSQMWCLMRALPLLLFDSVQNLTEVDQSHKRLLFLLQDIMRIVFAFEQTEEDLDQLDVLIIQHNELFKTLFIETPVELNEDPEEGLEENIIPDEEFEVDQPDDEDMEGEEDQGDDEELEAEEEEEVRGANARARRRRLVIFIINKMHHLKHYCAMCRKFGPAVRMWCAKFEGRMKIFRQHSAICCNFKNVPKTMARMFQLSNVNALCDEEEHSLEFKGGSNIEVRNMASEGQLFKTLGFSDTQVFVLTTSVSVDGEEYRPGLFVQLISQNRHAPRFALIVKIYVDAVGKSVYLLVKPWKILGLSLKYNCFKVAPQVNCVPSLFSISSLADFRAIAPWFVTENNDTYLSLRTGTF